MYIYIYIYTYIYTYIYIYILCVSLVRKAKKEYFDNLDLRNVTDNKKFWKTVKPLFTDKGMNHDKIILVEDDEITLLLIQ